MNNFIETEILLTNIKNAELGITNDFWAKASIDLNCIHHFWEHKLMADACVLCDDVGEVIFVINMPYDKFKQLFLNYNTNKSFIAGRN